MVLQKSVYVPGTSVDLHLLILSKNGCKSTDLGPKSSTDML